MPIKNTGIRTHLPDVAVVIIILLIGYVYTHGIEKVLDIGLWDESVYLDRGLHIPLSGFPLAQDAPLYALWYYLLSLFRPDAIDLYFLNYKLVTILPPLMMFVALRVFSVSRVLALVLSAAFLFCYANFPTWPKVSHFAVLVLLCGFALSGFIRDVRLQTAVLLMTAFVVSYIRPEFFLSVICLGAVLVLLSWRAFLSSRSFKSVLPLVVTLLPCMVVIILLGQPTASGERSMVAFGQHYAYNWIRWNNDLLNNPWVNWMPIIERDFGDARTPFQAVLNNPSAITHHVMQNLQSLPGELKMMFIFRYLSGSAAKVAFTFGALALIITGLASVRRRELTEARDRLRANWAALRFRATLFLIVLLPVLISVLAVAPRRHYLYILGALLVFGFTVLLFRNTDQDEGHASYSLIALLCLTLLLTVQPLSSLVKVTAQPNLQTIRFLRALNLTMPINILEADGGYYFYTGDNYKHVGEYNKNSSFADFVAERSIDMIIKSERLSLDIRFRNDKEWHAFTQNPLPYGFTRLDIPTFSEQRILYVRNELIKIQTAK